MYGKKKKGGGEEWPAAKFSFFCGQGHLFHYRCSSAKTNIIFESFIILVSGNGLNQHVLVLAAAEPAVVPGCTVSQCQRFKALPARTGGNRGARRNPNPGKKRGAVVCRRLAPPLFGGSSPRRTETGAGTPVFLPTGRAQRGQPPRPIL